MLRKIQKKNAHMQATFDAKVEGKTKVGKSLNPMHKTAVDAMGYGGSRFPSLPKIKADGELKLPISNRDIILNKMKSKAYELSPKVANQLHVGESKLAQRLSNR